MSDLPAIYHQPGLRPGNAGYLPPAGDHVPACAKHLGKYLCTREKGHARPCAAHGSWSGQIATEADEQLATEREEPLRSGRPPGLRDLLDRLAAARRNFPGTDPLATQSLAQAIGEWVDEHYVRKEEG